MRIIQPRVLKILGAKLNGKKSSGKKFLKIWVYHAKWSFLSEILENAVFYSLLEVAENSDLMQNMQIVQKKSKISTEHFCANLRPNQRI